MCLVTAVTLGLVGAGMLPVSLIPQVDIPYITVQLSYPPMSARELDEAVVKPLRQQLMQMPALRDIRSETKDGSGVISLTFEHGTGTDYLFVEANEKIDRLMGSMPRDMERPTVIRAGATDIPAFYVNISVRGEDDYVPDDELYPVSDRFMQLSDFAANVIAKRIEQLPEVAMADMSGLVRREILVVPDRDKMRLTGLTIPQFEAAIKSANVGAGNLTIRDGEYRYNVIIQDNAASRNDVENVCLNISGRIYRVGELATVAEHPQPRSCIVSSDGGNAVTLAVVKQADARMSALKTAIGNLMDNFSRDYPDVKFTLTRDQTELLDYSIDNLLQNIVLGVLLACVVILLFMRNLRSAMIVVVAIPVALVVSMLLFYLLGISINIISLSGLVLGAGMMVDNSIIVIDNITFRRERGDTLREAVVDGTREVFVPMLSSTLTTCAVFVPLIFLSGMAGALFYDQAMAVTITLFSSLGVTMTVIPVYFYLLYRRKDKMVANRFLEKLSFGNTASFYERGVAFLMRRRWIMWGSFALAVAVGAICFEAMRKQRLPEITYRDALLHVDWNERITVEENSCRAAGLAEHLSAMTSQTTVMAGVQQFVLDHTRRMSMSEATVYVMAADGVKIGEVERAAREYVETGYPQAIFATETSGNIFDVVFAEKEPPLVARIRPTNGQAPAPEALDRLLERIAAKLGDENVRPVAWQEHVLYVAQPEIMALYGVTYGELVAALRNALNENRLFTIMQGRLSIPVIVGENRSGLAELLAGITIRKDRAEYPASMFMKQTRERDLKSLVAGPEDNFYPLELDAGARQIPATMAAIRETVAQDGNFEASFSGSYFSSRGMVWELTTVLLVALLLLYFILAAQFESLVQPLIILSEIAIDVSGTLLVLWLCGESLNIMSLIGLVVICGIVINDSILKVDAVNRLRREGVPLLRAVLTAGERKLKPIIMTSLTTILAVAPFLVRGDMGSDLQYPLSVAVIAGMIFGTVVSVYFIPLLYYSIYRRGSYGRRKA
jgi:multidrug efflux pump subunit AcrB